MRKWILAAMIAGLCVSVFGQNSRDVIVGTWRNDREKQVFQFHADGTFIMSEDSEEAMRAIREEQRNSGEVFSNSLRGTYTVTGRRVDMALEADGKTHKMRMSIINADTLRMFSLDYKRVPGIQE